MLHLKRLILAAAVSTLALAPAFAQEHHGGGGHGPAPSGHFSGGHSFGPGHGPGGHIAPGGHFAGGHGFAPGPHGFAPGGHFAQNGAWHGGFDHWRGGHWVHGVHGGRFGWWWAVGPDWFYYDAPVYPYPEPYAEPYGATAWYYCPALNNYYPYVQSCPGPWQVVPQG